MASPRTTSLHAAAARNNADWCASVCRSHGIPSTVDQTAWRAARRPPPYYPDAITLHPDAAPADFLPRIDTASPGCAVKDSFAALDLTPHGFVELFTACWIHRPPGIRAPAASALPTEQVTTPAQLHDWRSAWHGGDGAPDIFRPALLDDPSVQVLAVRDGEHLHGGAVLNRGVGLVGLTNLFTVRGGDVAAVWSSVVAAAATRFPGLPLVGYEHDDDLAAADASGFLPIGTLRVWRHGP